MTFPHGHSPFTIRNLRRGIEAHLPQKAVRDFANKLRFGADAPRSDEALFADPRAIVSSYSSGKSGAGRKFRRHESGLVRGGDWDRAQAPIEKGFKLTSCRMHFEDNIPWEDTPLFQRLITEVKAGRTPDGCRSVSDVQQRYAKLDTLFAEARRDGRLKLRSETPERYRREHGGILVHVTRDGKMLRAGGGAHRFAVAWILGLPEIPVQLGVIHTAAVHAGLHKILRLPLSQRSAISQG